MNTNNHNPLVSIVLPCRNEQGYIQACLQSALDQEPPQGEVEILVADGMSTDGTREYLEQMAKQHPQLRVLDNPGRIVSTGLNAAIRAARGDIIVRMDAHTTYAPDYVRRCLAVLSETGADNVGGPMQTTAATFMERAIRAVFDSALAVGGARSHQADYEGDVDTVIYALGTTANPIIAQTTPGLGTNKWGYIDIDERTGMTNVPGLFAGGDIVTGAATVILAMGAGKRAAQGMLEFMGVLTPDASPELVPAGGA